MIQTSRRSFITGLVSFVAAPAIVKASSLMPVRVMPNEAALARAMREYIERIVNPPLMAAMQDFAIYGASGLSYSDGVVQHIPYRQLFVARDQLPAGLLAMPGMSPKTAL